MASDNEPTEIFYLITTGVSMNLHPTITPLLLH